MSTPPHSFEHRPGKPSRNVGDAPGIGQVARMHKESESRAGRYRQHRSSREEPKRGLDTKTAVIGGVAVLALAAAGIGIFAWSVRSRGGETAAPAALSSGERKPAPAPVPEETELLELTRDFLAARTAEDLEPLARPGGLDASEMAEELAGILAKEGQVTRLRYMGSLDCISLPLEAVLVDFQEKRNRLALISPDESGRWRVDFDAFARRVSPSWEELLSGKAVTGTVRIFGAPDSYYNGLYRDDSRWACFGLASPDNEMLMFGYVPRDSPQYHAMMSSLTEPAIEGEARAARPYSRRLTLEIRHDPAAEKRQFEITRVLSDEWAVGDLPLDEKLASPLSAGAEESGG